MAQQEFFGDTKTILSSLLATKEVHSIFLVRGKQSYITCGAQHVIDLVFKETNILIQEFYDFEDNPKIEDIERGTKLLNNTPTDLIIAIGGGSVLDMAKSIRFLHQFRLDTNFNIVAENHFKPIPLIAIPTTAGTGCESTCFSVVYRNKTKYSLEHNSILPDIAIVDAAFTYNMPKYLTACSGFDALAQAIESFWSVNATPESKVLAEKAIQYLWTDLPLAVNAPNKKNRYSLAQGSHLAGQAINLTRTTAPHAFSYAFTSYYGYPHGHAVAMTFPFFMIFNYGTDEANYYGKESLAEHHRKMDVLYRLLGIRNSDDAFERMTNYIQSLDMSLELPSNFSEDVIYNNINLQRLDNNPIKITPSNLPFNKILKTH